MIYMQIYIIICIVNSNEPNHFVPTNHEVDTGVISRHSVSRVLCGAFWTAWNPTRLTSPSSAVSGESQPFHQVQPSNVIDTYMICIYIYIHVMYDYIIVDVYFCVFHRDFRISVVVNLVDWRFNPGTGAPRHLTHNSPWRSWVSTSDSSVRRGHSRKWCVHHWENSFCRELRTGFSGSEVMQNATFLIRIFVVLNP